MIHFHLHAVVPVECDHALRQKEGPVGVAAESLNSPGAIEAQSLGLTHTHPKPRKCGLDLREERKTELGEHQTLARIARTDKGEGLDTARKERNFGFVGVVDVGQEAGVGIPSADLYSR
jgi:hypothetical protein